MLETTSYLDGAMESTGTNVLRINDDIKNISRNELRRLLRKKRNMWLSAANVSPIVKGIIKELFSEDNLTQQLTYSEYYVNAAQQPVLTGHVNDENRKRGAFNLGTLEYLIQKSGSDSSAEAAVRLLYTLASWQGSNVCQTLLNADIPINRAFVKTCDLLQRTKPDVELQQKLSLVNSAIYIRDHTQFRTRIPSIFDMLWAEPDKFQYYHGLLSFLSLAGILLKQYRCVAAPLSERLVKYYSESEPLLSELARRLDEVLPNIVKNERYNGGYSSAFNEGLRFRSCLEEFSLPPFVIRDWLSTINFFNNNLFDYANKISFDSFCFIDIYDALEQLNKTLAATISSNSNYIIELIFERINAIKLVDAYGSQLRYETRIIKALAENIVNDNHNGIYRAVLDKLNIKKTDDLDILNDNITRALAMPPEQFTDIFGNDTTFQLDLLRAQCAIQLLLHPNRAQHYVEQFARQMQQRTAYTTHATQQINAIIYADRPAQNIKITKEPVQIIAPSHKTLTQIANNLRLTSDNHVSNVDLDAEYNRIVTQPLVEQQVEAAKSVIDGNSGRCVIIVRDKELIADKLENLYLYTPDDDDRNPYKTPGLKEIYCTLSAFPMMVSYKEMEQNPNWHNQYGSETPYIILDAPKTCQEKKHFDNLSGIFHPILRVDDPIVAKKLYEQNINPQNLGTLAQPIDIDITNDNGRIILSEVCARCRALEELITPELATTYNNLNIAVQTLLDFIVSSGLLEDASSPKYLHTIRIISAFPQTGQLLLSSFNQQITRIPQASAKPLYLQVVNALILSTEPDIRKRLHSDLPLNRNILFKYYPKNDPNSLFGGFNDEEMQIQFENYKTHVAFLLASLDGYHKMFVGNLIIQAIQNGDAAYAVNKLLKLDQLSSMQRTQLCIAINNLNAMATTPSFSSNPFKALLQHLHWFGFAKEKVISKEQIIGSIRAMGVEEAQDTRHSEFEMPTPAPSIYAPYTPYTPYTQDFNAIDAAESDCVHYVPYTPE